MTLVRRVVLIALATFGIAATPAPAPDLILHHAKVFTGATARPWVKAVAIRGERIVATGSDAEVLSLAGKGTRSVDVGGRTVIPGIDDAHVHLDLEPPGAVDVELAERDPTWEQMQTALQAAVKRAAPGAFVGGTISWTIFNDLSVNRDALDRISRDHPIELDTLTGHATILNSAALSRLDIGEQIRDPVGGRFERFPDGRLSGVVREYAVFEVSRRETALTSEAEAVAQLRDRFRRLASWGVTSIQALSGSVEPRHAAQLLAKVPTPIRVRVVPMPGTTPAGRDTREGAGLPVHPAPLITISGRKWFLDGVFIEFTLDPRGTHPKPTGAMDSLVAAVPLTFPPREMKAMLEESLRTGQQLLLHATGYPAAKAMLEAMQETGGPKVWASRRVRFEHGDGLFPDLLGPTRALGVVVVQNPSHFVAFPGNTLEKGQPLKSLLAHGIPLALGSDGPPNPFLNILFATQPLHRPSEAISREEAVIAFTRGSAYAEGAEGEKGTLEPGKLADLAVLSRDIFTVAPSEIPGTESVLTLVGGKVVHDAGVLPH
jgi:predicted amidohydrolase YtcJ